MAPVEGVGQTLTAMFEHDGQNFFYQETDILILIPSVYFFKIISKNLVAFIINARLF